MKWKIGSLITLMILLLAANFYLIFKKDSKISRSTFIEDWKAVEIQDLVLSKEKEGVVVPASEEHVYFQTGIGDFGQFLVEEGEEVEEEDPLFEYSSSKIEANISQLEAEITELENEQDALEDHIDDLERIERNLTPSKDEEEPAKEAMASTIKAEIYEKEMELTRIESEIEKYEEFVSISSDSLDSLAVSSPISGIVKEIRHDLKNPVITISSTEKLVKGILAEDEISEIQEGMETVLTGSFGKREGFVSAVAATPVEEPDIHTKAQYQFLVELEESLEDEEIEEESFEDEEIEDEEMEEGFEEEEIADELEDAEQPALLTGNHVKIKIITHEAEDALTLPEGTVKKQHIYVLQADGTIEKREVETGIKVNKVYEIVSDAEEGELVVYQPSFIRNHSEFYTPIDFTQVKKKTLSEMGKKEMFRYLGRGLLSS